MTGPEKGICTYKEVLKQSGRSSTALTVFPQLLGKHRINFQVRFVAM